MSKKVKEQSSLNQIKTSTNVLFNIIFLLLGLMCIFPLLFVFSISITSEEALRSGTYQIIPQQLSNAAYMFLWNERGTILRAFCMSVLVTVVGTVITIILTTSMGYVASRRNFKLKKLYTWIIFIPMVFNGGMLASYVVVNNILNLRNTIWALILPLACSSFSVTICRTFFRITVPDALIEAAKIDGASKLQQIRYVTLPSMAPTLSIMLIMRIGQILNIGYEKVMLLYTPASYETADVISTFVYRQQQGDGTTTNYMLGTAADLFNSLIAMCLVLGANAISRRVSDTALF